MAFEGEREIERVQKMQKFVVDINKQYKGMRANPIPEIPVLLGETYISDNFIGTYDDKNRLSELAMIRLRLYFMKFRRIIC